MVNYIAPVMNHDPTDLASQDRRAQAQRAVLEEARRVEVEDIKNLMGSKAGRRFMWRLLGEAGLYRTSFNTNGSTVMFNEGKRHIGLVLIADINEHCPHAFIEMLTEQSR